MNYNDKFQNLKDKYNITEKLLNNNSDTDIMSQLSQYNYNDIESNIKKFDTILKEQENLNLILKSENDTGNIEEMKNFVNQYSETIEEQKKKLVILNKNIKNLVEENDKLKIEKKEYKYMINSHEYKNVANCIREIKTNCDEIKHFLVSAGILNNF